MEFRYRYEDNITEDGVSLNIVEFMVIKKTKCGAWVKRAYLGSVYGKEKFTLNGHGKRLCHETKEMAWDYFCMRKKSQFRISSHSMERAEFALLKIGEIKAAPKDDLNLGKPDFWERYVFD